MVPRALQTKLYNFLGFEGFELITTVLDNRAALVRSPASNSRSYSDVMTSKEEEQEEDKEQDQQLDMMSRQQAIIIKHGCQAVSHPGDHGQEWEAESSGGVKE